MKTTEIEKRLTAIEREVANLKAERAPAPKSHPAQTLEAIHGRFENDEAFQEAMRLGRKWRKSQRLPPDSRKPKAKRK